MTSGLDLLGRLPHRAGRACSSWPTSRSSPTTRLCRLLAGRGHRHRAQARVESVAKSKKDN
ncbi:MAG: hypothetical protein M0C28_33060 [Candidatus Moduliflexus flocculans]|nr:hypothetical protein [Candidatus Moduliflexus flocculans]